MKNEVDDGAHGVMTEAEMAYLAAMEEVKIVSKQLVVAEKAYTLVRDRIERLVAKYEALLVGIENVENVSIISESTYYSEMDSRYTAEEEREMRVWARRAQRAELRAELAAREALMAKTRAVVLKEEKAREIQALKQQLADLQSESSQMIAEREHSIVLARSFAQNRGPASSTTSGSRIDQIKVDGVKQRFRERMKSRRKNATIPEQRPLSRFEKSPADIAARNRLMRSAGEEMFQHLDFYERSLKAVEKGRDKL